MNAWDALAEELRRWQLAGRVASLWWRDDDACAEGPRLRRLRHLSRSQQIPLVLAVIPGALQPSLEAGLFEGGHFSLWQHGVDHHNLAPAGERKCEFPRQREARALMADLARGRQRLEDRFGTLFQPILVPPWNRIAPSWLVRLPEAGLQGLSTLGPRQPLPVPLVNVHVDLINWREGRRFAGEVQVLEGLCAHLRARRLGQVDAEEPSGLMTHHGVQDEACWGFLERLLPWLSDQPAVRWVSGPELF